MPKQNYVKMKLDDDDKLDTLDYQQCSYFIVKHHGVAASVATTIHDYDCALQISSIS